MQGTASARMNASLEELVFAALDWAMETVASGETLIPSVVTRGSDGTLTRKRLLALNMPEAESMLHDLLHDPNAGTQAYAFATDRLVSYGDGPKRDTIMIEAAERTNEAAVMLLQTYQKLEAGKSFGALGNPQLQPDRLPNRYTAAAPPRVTTHGFSLAEWSILKQSAVLVFMAVAAADGSVDQKEVTSFQKLLTKAGNFESKLMRQLLVEVIDEIPALIRSLLSEKPDLLQHLHAVAVLVESKLSAAEADQFKNSLLFIGKTVAEASGGFFGFGSKIGKEERVALAAVIVALRMKL